MKYSALTCSIIAWTFKIELTNAQYTSYPTLTVALRGAYPDQVYGHE